MTGHTAFILTNSEDATSDYLCERLQQGGVRHVRFDTDTAWETAKYHCDGSRMLLRWECHSVRPADISVIILRRPKPFQPMLQGDQFQKVHAGAEWAETLEGFLAHINVERWMNHPGRNFGASHKIEQLSRARQVGLRVPASIVTTCAEAASAFLARHRSGVVVKPLASGFIERSSPDQDTVIFTSELDQSNSRLLERLPQCPVLFQERLHKTVDVRLIAVDGRLLAVGLQATEADGRQRLDVRRNNMVGVEYHPLRIPSAVSDSVRRMLAEYGLRFAALDFAVVEDNEWVFLEVNPNGQWAWLDLEGGVDAGSMFVDALRDAAGGNS